MERTCTECQRTFEITDDDLAMLRKLSPEINGQTFPLPPPTKCFDCRLQRRLAFYNCRKLYWRTCDATKKPTLSVYSPDKPFTIYESKYWWSDDWDALQYGRDVDFSRPFFAQVRELMDVVPRQALSKLGTDVNSDYTNDAYKMKNCYLVFDGEQAEDCYYGQTFTGVKNCIDFTYLHRCELCYECTHCDSCYALRYSRFCVNCSDAWFLRDCIGCKNCFGCANLRQKQYCIWNEQKTPEEYAEFMRNFDHTSSKIMDTMKEKTEAFFLKHPVRAMRGEQNVDVSGDNLFQCKNCRTCFDCITGQDCAYCTNCMLPMKDCLDVHIWGDGMELVYESALIGAGAQRIIGGFYVLLGCDNVYYSQWCRQACRNLFGCVCLNHKEYCILNRQYTKEEYDTLVPKIIEHMRKTGEWGEYYPIETSTYGYNETMAQIFFPMTKEEVMQKGWQWCDFEPDLQADRVIRAEDLPDALHEIPDDVVHWAITCEATGKPFKVIMQELDFYRTQGLPFPRRHPDRRNDDRYRFKNPYRLFTRMCDQCKKPIQTTYSPDRPEIVYCEKCYLKEVY